ncbi:acetoacetate metabolism regulatory protein AtoC [compost metagenome]
MSIADFGSLEGADQPPGRRPAGTESLAGQGKADIREAKERVECELILEAMRRTGGNKKRVAEELGISRSYLYKRLSMMEEARDDEPASR